MVQADPTIAALAEVPAGGFARIQVPAAADIGRIDPDRASGDTVTRPFFENPSSTMVPIGRP
jgi:hypothetical protein